MNTLLPKNIYAICFYSVMALNYACKKQDNFLDAKPNDALFTVTTLQDCQSLLLNDGVFNSNDPGLGTASSDEYYVTTSTWTSRPGIERNLYTWAPRVYDAGAQVNDWNNAYSRIYYANTILDALTKIKNGSDKQDIRNQIKGAALFFRAFSFYNLVQTFAMPYDQATANSQLGIPLRLNSDLNVKSIRASEEQCYDQIFQDLQTALPLLPVTTTYNTQPTKAAANALLARIYLAIGNYPKAFQYADACLSLNKTLVDYNNLIPTSFFLTTSSQYPLVEDIFHCVLNNYAISGLTRAIVDSTLYQSYSANDLRKSFFFQSYRGALRFTGSYELKQSGQLFSGLATDEMYLIRAESNARIGNTTAAMADLNTLLIKRWKTGTFIPFTATGPDDALAQILNERKKELVFRGTRWTDLRRLNKDPRFSITLTRVINGTTYTLPPNDNRYALPIPDPEIALSGIQQNPR